MSVKSEVKSEVIFLFLFLIFPFKLGLSIDFWTIFHFFLALGKGDAAFQETCLYCTCLWRVSGQPQKKSPEPTGIMYIVASSSKEILQLLISSNLISNYFIPALLETGKVLSFIKTLELDLPLLVSLFFIPIRSRSSLCSSTVPLLIKQVSNCTC